MAVKKEKVHDGLFTATRVTVDANDTSNEAISALCGMLNAATPHSRIAAIEKFIYNLPNDSEIDLLRTEKISEIITQIKQLYPGLSLDNNGLEMLNNAEMWRREIEAMPLASIGKARSEQQKFFREAKQKLDEEKHKNWCKWQADEKAKNPQFARLKSKHDQAKRLKEQYSIPDKVGTIAKRLEPLPPNRQTKKV